MDLSIIITAHSEGIIAHKTMRSVFRALEEIPDKSYEIIIHIDNGNDETIHYFERYKDDDRVKIFQNSFGDLGLSRNFAIQKASGDYIQILDADDLIASQHLVQAFKQAEEAKKDYLYHPEYVLSFGDEYLIKIQHDAYSIEDCARLLLIENEWCSMVFGKRQIFLDTPYYSTDEGVGHEDWMFNTKTSAKGIIHKVIKDVPLFYRKNGDSLVSQNNSKHVTQPYSPLFAFDNFRKYKIKETPKQKLSAKESAVKFYKKLRSIPTINAFITPAAILAKKVTGKKMTGPEMTYFKDTFLKCLQDASLIDNSVFPSERNIERLGTYEVGESYEASLYYQKYAKIIGDENIYYVFFVPWINVGGADKVIINYAKAIRDSFPDRKILFIGTMPSDNPWAKKLPDNSFFINFGSDCSKMPRQYQDTLISRLVIESKCKRIHILNSEAGFKWAQKHANYTKTHDIKVTASLFARSQLEGYKKTAGFYDFADPFIINCYSGIDAIYTDNDFIHGYLIDDCGMDGDIIKTHYQPCLLKVHPAEMKTTNQKFEILWASRVCEAKNPELLKRIAQRLDPNYFHITAFGVTEWPYNKDFFKKTPNLTYGGAYNGIDSIDPEKYDCFLYTSIADGLPNTLLEIAKYKLPIIASDAGGVKDFINEKTGILISDIENETAYIDAVEKLATNSKLRRDIAEGANMLVEERHSWSHFINQIKEDF